MRPPTIPPVKSQFEDDPMFILLDRDIARLERVRAWRRRATRRALPRRMVRPATEARS